MAEPRRLRCAVYTRKSSEEGLEQAFNSLDAQREACEAYIKSQRHEGWQTLPAVYDDGGISGGTMERPALKRLLVDIAGKRIDIVVVYKVDRLTRSLADFAKIVEVFDAHGVSFVSITQQFNTTSSMGRLTLNILLSFAQFEREVTGERIRDKIAASKAKGMWMGGPPPFGYDVRDRKLVVNPAEAGTVQHIYQRYLALGSVRALKEELQAAGIVSKARVDRHGRPAGAKPIQRGALYIILSNETYIGRVSHKGNSYQGEHEGIVEPELWRQVQARLENNRVDREMGEGATEPSLLAGILYDEHGGRLTPSHTGKAGRRYRYYVSHALMTEGTKAGKGLRLPAGEIEQIMTDWLHGLLSDGSRLLALADGQAPQALIRRAAELAASWEDRTSAKIRAMILAVIGRIVVAPDAIELHLMRSGLIRLLGGVASDRDEETVIRLPARLKRVGLGKAMLVDGAAGQAKPDPKLLRLLAQAHRLHEQVLQAQPHLSMEEIAANLDVNPSTLTRLLRLVWLAPDITQAILDGRQPRTLIADRLMRGTPLPIEWDRQRKVLGF